MKKLILIITAIAFMSSCKNSSKQQKEEPSNPKLVEYHERAKEVFDRPAIPSEISILLKSSGAPLMAELMHDPSAWKKFANDQTSAAANMGVYLADALVFYAYDSIRLSYNSAMAGKSLAEVIGIDESVFRGYLEDRYIYDRQADSLFFVLDAAMARADNSLSSNERFRLLSALYVGNFIEKMYIVSNIIFSSQVDLPDEPKLLLQREMMLVMKYFLYRLDYIIELVEEVSINEEGKYLLNDLKILKEMYVEHMYTDEELYKLKAYEIFENEGLLGMHELIGNMRNFIVTQGK